MKYYLPAILFASILSASRGQQAAVPISVNPGAGGSPCQVDSDCRPIQCLIPPCPAAVCGDDGTCTIERNPPNPECVQDSDCPVINCFAAPCDRNVCNAGVCELVPAKKQEDTSEETVVGVPAEEEESVGVPCGVNICLGGQVCCNESCSICTYPDEVSD